MLAFDFTVKSMAQTAIQAPTYGEKGAIMAQDFGDDIGEMLLLRSKSDNAFRMPDRTSKQDQRNTICVPFGDAQMCHSEGVPVIPLKGKADNR